MHEGTHIQPEVIVVRAHSCLHRNANNNQKQLNIRWLTTTVTMPMQAYPERFWQTERVHFVRDLVHFLAERVLGAVPTSSTRQRHRSEL